MSVIDPTSSKRPSGVDAAELSALLTALEAVVPAASEGGELLESAAALADILATFTPADPHKDIGLQLSHHLQAQQIRLAPALKVRLMVLQNLYSELEEASPLEESLQHELRRLRPALLASGLREQDLLTNSQHNLRQFIDNLCLHGGVWYTPSCREGTVFYDAVVQAVDAILLAVKNNQPAVIAGVVEDFVALAGKQQARAQMMEQRCADSELGMANIHRAQAQVIGLLEALNGCALPESVLQFARSTLKGELQFILINHTEAAAAWQSWSAIITRLPQVFPALVPEEDKPVEPDSPNRQQLYRDVQIIVGLLDEHVTVSTANQQAYDDGVEDLRERLFEKLRGISVPLFEFTPLTSPDELSLMGAVISPSLLKKVAGLHCGDWFVFHNSDDQLLRCKLLLRPPEVTQLLFVNRSGHRVLQKSVQDFSACLATQIARPLIVEPLFAKALVMTVEKLQQFVVKSRTVIKEPVLKQALLKQAAETKRAETGAEPVEVEEKPAAVVVAEPASPTSDRKSAAQKALQEARVLARLSARRERQRAQAMQLSAAVRNAPLNDEERRQQAQLAVDSLNIGAWLDLPEVASDSLQRCKLVAIMRSTDTFIFTNRSGVKVAEFERTGLAELLANGTALVHSSGDNFEGQLSKVVLTLRRDLS